VATVSGEAGTNACVRVFSVGKAEGPPKAGACPQMTSPRYCQSFTRIRKYLAGSRLSF
jgi:hypothetical protein